VAFSLRVGKQKAATAAVALLVNGLLTTVSAFLLQIGLVLLAGFAWVWTWTVGEVMARGLVASSTAASAPVTGPAASPRPRLRLVAPNIAAALVLARAPDRNHSSRRRRDRGADRASTGIVPDRHPLLRRCHPGSTGLAQGDTRTQSPADWRPGPSPRTTCAT